MMNANDQTNGGTPPVVLATLGGLVSLPILHILTSPLGKVLNAHVAGWLFLGLFTVVPMSVAFLILYRSVWHREYSRSRRIASVLLSTCLVYCVDLMLAALLLLIACIMIGLTRAVGGN